jgi:hypothetical protein
MTDFNFNAEVVELRRAAVALRREWEEPRSEGSWKDVAVWFASLAMVGPQRTRGIGVFASVVLISRTWAAAHRRHTRHVNDVVGHVVELLVDDLEDREATGDALEEQAAELALLRSHTDWHADHDATVEQRLSGLEHAVAIDAVAVEDETAVRIPVHAARAVRAFIHGDHFEAGDIDEAVAAIDAFIERHDRRMCERCKAAGWDLVDNVADAVEHTTPWDGPVEVVATHSQTPSMVAGNARRVAGRGPRGAGSQPDR